MELTDVVARASPKFTVVLIEDDDADAELILAELASARVSVNVRHATNEREARAALSDLQDVDAVLCDYRLPDFDALRALELLNSPGIAVPLIVVSGGLSDEVATECMRRGAADYILKDRLGRLPHALTQAIRHTRAERAGREVERSYQRLFENLPMAVLRATARGQILHANPAAVAMFGYADLEGLMATSTVDLYVDPGDRRALVARLETQGHVVDFECRMRRADGSEFWFSCVVHVVTAEDGRMVLWETIGRDVSERKRAERELAQSEAEAERRTSRRAAKETLLLELARAGLEGDDTTDFLAMAIEVVARGTETQFATILEMTPSGGGFVRVASHGQPEEISPDSAPIEAASRVFDAMTSAMPVVTFDYQALPRIRRSPWMIGAGVVATLAVGIRGAVCPFGVLCVHTNVAREFDADDLHFMQMAGTTISVAVERKREEQQRRLLLSRLVTAQEAERRSIAADIHDDAVQVMTAANMRLELFRMALTDPVQVEAAEKLQETVSLATGRLRNLLFELNPADLERHGLAAALRSHLEQFEVDVGVRWELDAKLDMEPAPQLRILLFRIFQEALVNVRKHAHATKVTVALKTEDGGVMMRVADDGAGFLESAAEPLMGHLGLASMRERAEIAGGWWRITSAPGHGTEILTWAPSSLDQDVAEADGGEVAIG